MKHYLFCLAVLCMIFQGCHSKAGTQKGIPGQVVSKVTCKKDTGVSYALYLPKNFSASKEYPLMLCFDSHGSGRLPVDLFRNGAERNGFILAGSNNSKNGLTGEETSLIAERTLNDLKEKYHMDGRRIYLCGFSGGARVAGGYAMTNTGIAGVICCGAGLPNNRQPVREKFSFLGVAGNEDFNYTELKELDKQLEEAGFDHSLLVFKGKHEWPPKTLVPEIFQWLQFDAMRQQAVKKDLNAIGRFVVANDSLANLKEKNKLYTEQLAVYVKMLQFLKGVVDVNALQQKISQLNKKPEVILQQQEEKAILEKERAMEQNYSQAFATEDIPYWQRETARLNGWAWQSSKTAENLMYKRVLGSLSLQAYMYATGMLKQGSLEGASKYISIYGIVDPGNPEHYVLQAELDLRQGKEAEALNNLEAAIKSGFKDKQRLLTDPAFASIKKDKRLLYLYKRM